MSDIIIIGDKDSCLGFKSIGFDTYMVQDGDLESQIEGINKIFRKEYKIIFLTENIYKSHQELIEQLTQNRLYPIAVAIPSVRGRESYSEKIIQNLVVKALGGSFLDEK